MKSYEVIHYTENGRDIFNDWYRSLRDMRGRAAIDRTLARVELGNFGTHHHCRDGVWELIIDYGPGYRIYYCLAGKRVVLLLCGGTKRGQNRDIDQAVEYLKKFKGETE